MAGIIKALGLVFGDIGTSPIYTITVVFLILEPTRANIIGVLSLVFWTLVLLPTIQYNLLAMSLSIRGEGGTIVLGEIFKSLLKSTGSKTAVALLSFVGVSLLMGDGVITPAISILSAVEGSALIPGLEGISQTLIVLISIVIAILLFSFQRKGTEKVAFTFGPVMIIWFFSLLFLGLNFIIKEPTVLNAINPVHAIEFLLTNGWKGYLILGEVILCATGSEAMYADMGHLGSRPIREAWVLVFISLVVNYFGQGAFLLIHPEAKNILFEMVLSSFPVFYIPFLLLSISATIIASQAMISGMFSIVYQAITTRIMPVFKIDYTSRELRSQIYIGSVNWFLCIAVIFMMIEFGHSSKLASAYGLAVTGDMTITGLAMTSIFFLKRQYLFSIVAGIVTIVDLSYFSSTLHKIPSGGYWSIVLALFPFTMILLFTQGQKRLYRFMDFMSKDEFILKFERFYRTNPKIPGTALFLVKDASEIPPYIIETMFFHGIIYEENIFLSIIRRPDPFGVTGFFKEDLCCGIKVFEIQMGYMEVINVEEILRENGIEERAIFYGLEDISAKGPVWKAFSMLKRMTPTFVSFFQLPPKKLHGVLTRIEM